MTTAQAQELQTTSPVEYGPLVEEMRLSAGLDYYKPTMSQLQYEKHGDAEVTFTFKNRGEQRIADFVDAQALQVRLDELRANGFQPAELEYLGSLKNGQGEQMFSPDFVDYLATNSLPPVEVRLDPEIDDIAVTTEGAWPLVTFWETIVMSEVSEMYFENFVQDRGLDLMEVYDEGDRRLSEKIAFLQANPDIKVADFGTRRRFSLRWQRHVVERLKNECPENLAGTSNVALAQEFGLKPIGTFAHEMPMVYAGLTDAAGRDIRASHGEMLDDWYDFYGDELAIALSDTFGSDFFFEDFTQERAVNYRATRQDSGNPFEYREKTLEFYRQAGIDPNTKSITFSDNLNMAKVEKLHRFFKGKILHNFGIGTHLTNDLGLKALNQVMKATHAREPITEVEVDLVKLSDDAGKHTGPEDKVKQYEQVFEPGGTT